MPNSDSMYDQIACEQSIKKGSLSFALASLLLSLKHREAIHTLYSWCRWCDNAIDDIPTDAPTEIKHAAIEGLRNGTKAALTNSYDGQNFVFRSLQQMNLRYRIPPRYFEDLISGMEMDIAKHRYKNFDELRLYCYRVAGVVGLMFSHVVGLREQSARDNAVALGTAMQLTNIARDVSDDYKMGRVYLPETWLREAGVSLSDPLQNTQGLWPVVAKLLAHADQYYQVGDQGMRALPWKAALAAKAARLIYADIGRKISKTGPAYFGKRTVVSGPRKLLLLAKAFIQVSMQLPFRIRHPFHQSVSTSLWRYQ